MKFKGVKVKSLEVRDVEVKVLVFRRLKLTWLKALIIKEKTQNIRGMFDRKC